MERIKICLLLLFARLLELNAVSKFSMVECEISDPDYADKLECDIKLSNGGRTALFIAGRLKRNITNCVLKFNVKKKMANVWRPLFKNKMTLDVCEFFINSRKFYLTSFIYKLTKKYTSVNHSCPYMQDEIIKLYNFNMDENGFLQKFPIDSGEYGIFMEFYMDNKQRGSINGSVVYTKTN